MKKINQCAYVILLAFLGLLFSCNDDAENPDTIQLLINSSVEAGSTAPNQWWPNARDYTCTWTDEHAYSDSKSLKTSSDTITNNFAYWVQTVRSDIPYGRRLRLSAMIKLDKVETDDYGVSLVIRGDDDSSQIFFYTTQGDIPIRGDEDWEKYSIDMKSAIPEEVKSIHVFLVLAGNTMGTVYFDDITLETIN